MSDLSPGRWLQVKHAMRSANQGEWSQRWAQVWLDRWHQLVDTEIALTKLPIVDADCDPIIVRFGAVVLRGDPRLLRWLFEESAIA